MKIYLASRYSRRLEMLAHAQALQAAGHTVTSRWVFGAHDGAFPDEDLSRPEHRATAAAFALEDMHDVQEADLLLAFTEAPLPFASRGGRHVELGLALAWMKQVWVVGPLENIFYTFPAVQQFSDFAGVLERLARHLHDEMLAPQCRRCTVCDGLTHHWMVDVDENDPPAYGYVCKHCSVVGISCVTCDGDDDADPDCSACHGEGVVRIGGLRVVDPDEDC